MNFKSHNLQYNLEIAKNIQKSAQELCDRWVKAWINSGYKYAQNVTIHWDREKISFKPFIVDGIVDLYYEIDFKYFEDSSTLEVDAAEWYKNDREKRSERFQKEKTLESDPKVQEYIKLRNFPSYFRQIF